MLTDYTDQQARMDDAFSQGGTTCDTQCEECERTYFVTSLGYGDYDDGRQKPYESLLNSFLKSI